jgi:hypothetical protein
MKHGPTLPLRDAKRLVDATEVPSTYFISRRIAMIKALRDTYTEAYCAGVADARLDVALRKLGIAP